MKALTLEHLLIAFSAGTVTFLVTYATLHYINPSIKKAVR